MSTTSEKMEQMLIKPSITQEKFGLLSDGRPADIFHLTRKNGCRIAITNYGGIIVGLSFPDKHGVYDDIVLGYDDLSSYESDPYYLGAIIGRYAGRIKNGQFSIGGSTFTLKNNAPDSQLHGGKSALNKQLWKSETTQSNNAVSLILSYTCPDGFNGFPGDVTFKVIYTLTHDNHFNIEYFASTNIHTIVNLTQHCYFNLTGHHHGSINHQELMINAKHYLPMNEQAYPTKEIMPVDNSPFDFTKKTAIGERIKDKHPQLHIGKGYDNYWLLPANLAEGEPVAEVTDPISGRKLTIHSSQPSIIFYSANYIDGSRIGKNNTRYQAQSAFCLETQRAFDYSLTKHDSLPFKTALLSPEQPFYAKDTWIFSTITDEKK